MAKWVYMFTEGNADMRNLLGGKGANLAEMTNLGLPVPQGFTITTEACTQYYEDGRKINDEIMDQIMEAIEKMEGITGKKFGDKENPLLVSVRSGARASMPGMMDTILNLGPFFLPLPVKCVQVIQTRLRIQRDQRTPHLPETHGKARLDRPKKAPCRFDVRPPTGQHKDPALLDPGTALLHGRLHMHLKRLVQLPILRFCS